MRESERFVLFLVLVTLTLVAMVATGCGEQMQASDDAGTVTITDLAGRSVEVTRPVESLVAIGPGALRLVCYLDAESDVVGIENFEKQSPIGRPYILAHPVLLELPVVGQGGPDSNPDPEALLEVDPDVIFVAYLVDASKADELQAKTGIPVVVLSYGQLGTFDEQLLQSLRLMGQITGRTSRAEEVVGYIEDCREDLTARTDGIAEVDKPSVYVGGLGMKGTHGIESSSAAYPPLVAIGAKNLADEAGAQGSVMIDKEQLVAWNPDLIFVDEGGLEMVKEDYSANPGLYQSLSAFEDGGAYGFLPFNYYTTNVGTALADAYFMGKTMFPEVFDDIDPAEKADEIYRLLLGEALYEPMAQDFGGFMRINLGMD